MKVWETLENNNYCVLCVRLFNLVLSLLATLTHLWIKVYKYFRLFFNLLGPPAALLDYSEEKKLLTATRRKKVSKQWSQKLRRKKAFFFSFLKKEVWASNDCSRFSFSEKDTCSSFHLARRPQTTASMEKDVKWETNLSAFKNFWRLLSFFPIWVCFFLICWHVSYTTNWLAPAYSKHL